MTSAGCSQVNVTAVKLLLRSQLGVEKPRGYYVDEDSEWLAAISEVRAAARGEASPDGPPFTVPMAGVMSTQSRHHRQT